jgi:hypothetical protein
VFLREHPEGSVLVCALRAGGPEIRLPASALGSDHTTLLGPDLTHDGDHVVLPGTDGPAFSLHALPALPV